MFMAIYGLCVYKTVYKPSKLFAKNKLRHYKIKNELLSIKFALF